MTAEITWAVLGLALGLRNAARASSTISVEQNFGRVFHWGVFHRNPIFGPLVVAATSLSYWATARSFDRNLVVLAMVIFVNAVIVHIAVDLDTHLLLRRINYRAMFLGTPWLVIAALVIDEPRRLGTMLLGAVLGWSVMTVLRVLSRGDLGGGDVSLCLMLGWFLGWVRVGHVAVALVLGFVLGGFWALAGVVTGRLQRRSHMPFGPFLGVAALVTLWSGDALWSAIVG